jgi:hypothetical protein
MSEAETSTSTPAGGSIAAGTTTSSAASLSGGRGGSRGQGGRGRGRGYANRGRGNTGNTVPRSTGPVFKGNTEGMNGNIFTCHGEGSPDKQQYMKTVGVLEEHVNKIFSYPQDVASVCKSFEIADLVQPANLSKTDYKTDMGMRMIWETLNKSHIKRKELQESNTITIYASCGGNAAHSCSCSRPVLQ